MGFFKRSQPSNNILLSKTCSNAATREVFRQLPAASALPIFDT